MGFGSELWDQTKMIEMYAEHGVQLMDKMNDFMKIIAAAEQEYAKTILKIVKQYKEEFVKKSNDKTNSVFYRGVMGR